MKTNVLINADCLSVMRNMPENCIDLTITDPPYGIGSDKGTNGFGTSKNKRYVGGWDKMRPPQEAFDEILRVSKRVLIFGGNYFADMLPPSKCWIVWDKKGDIKFKNPFADAELIYTNLNKPVKKIVFKQQGFITDSKDVRVHPTQKPSELVQQLIEQFSSEGDIVFDPYIGSGTTAVAAMRSGRKYIGVEISKAFYEIALNRINKE